MPATIEAPANLVIVFIGGCIFGGASMRALCRTGRSSTMTAHAVRLTEGASLGGLRGTPSCPGVEAQRDGHQGRAGHLGGAGRLALECVNGQHRHWHRAEKTASLSWGRVGAREVEGQCSQ
jgi:hypothetical protein